MYCMHKFNVVYIVYLIAITKIFLIIYTNTIRCKLVEEIFWKLQGCCVTQISFAVEYSVFWSEFYICPLPTCIFTKDGKTGNACFHQAELTLCL